MTRQLNFGIVGTGSMAAQMVQTIKDFGDCRVTAVVSETPERSQRFANRFEIAHSYSQLNNLVQSDKVNAIYVASRNGAHANAALKAIEARKPVLVEKPLTASWVDTKKVIACAKEAGCLVVENLWTLALPAHRALKLACIDQQVGDPRHLVFNFAYPAAKEAAPTLFNRDDGGVCLDRMIYGIAVALDLMGPVTECHSTVRRDKKGVDISAALQMVHYNGSITQVSASFEALGSNTLSVACSRGCLSVFPSSLGAEVVATERYAEAGQKTDSIAPPNLLQTFRNSIRKQPWFRRLNWNFSGIKMSRHSYGGHPYSPVLAHFCDLVDANQAESDIIPLSLSLEVMRLLEKVRNT